MTKIVILGGTGYAGSALVAEAAKRGLDVTSVSRKAPEQPIEGVHYVTGSVLDEQFLSDAVKGADVIVSALSPRGALAGKQRGVLAEVAAQAAADGQRFGVIGGAGSLQVTEGGPRVVDTDGFPDEFKAEANELAAVLDDLKAGSPDLDWFFISPAGGFGGHNPGPTTGTFRIGGDVLLVDEAGQSNLSAGDLAIAVLDEVEKPEHSRQRFTVAY
ncbi:NAD(P)-dependent oxidoreductase [Pseudoclavibacter soli]|uniref:NAD(P)-dependent oxidoreductase n=1 Tax=Pseudoclavibacter soli TaxID=452623 RepID=UPI0003FE9464|nr:NAD(P)H-binding protein [Pseudoclavibacter soli]